MKLSVVIPAFNEVGTIAEILRRVQGAPFDKEIVVVDDGSTDGTREYLTQLCEKNVKVVLHGRNRGKGAAIRTALQHVEGDVVIIQDADLEYDPRDYGVLLQPILEGRADVVYGSRFLGGPHRVLYFWHSVANRVLTILSNACTNLNLSDMETGYKAFRPEVLRSLKLRCDRFGFEPEVTAKVARGGWRVYEVPISYWGRDYAEGKKIRWTDGVLALLSIVRFRFFD